jgi:hypothetical protein
MPIKPEFLQDGNKQTVGLSGFVRNGAEIWRYLLPQVR